MIEYLHDLRSMKKLLNRLIEHNAQIEDLKIKAETATSLALIWAEMDKLKRLLSSEYIYIDGKK